VDVSQPGVDPLHTFATALLLRRPDSRGAFEDAADPFLTIWTAHLRVPDVGEPRVDVIASEPIVLRWELKADEGESTTCGQPRRLVPHLHAVYGPRRCAPDSQSTEVRRLRWLATSLDEPWAQPRRAVGIEQEATDNASLTTRNVEVPTLDPFEHLVPKPT